VLLPFGAWGLLTWRRQGRPWLLPVSGVLYGGTIVASHVCARYRLPILPVVIIVAFGGLLHWLSVLRSGGCKTRLAAGLGLLGFSLIPMLAPLHPRECLDYSAEFDIYYAQHLWQSGHPESALEALHNAERKVPSKSVIQDMKAGFLAALGRRGESERVLRGLLEQRPDYIRARLRLAALLEKRGAMEEARYHLNTALRQNAVFARHLLIGGKMNRDQSGQKAR
jgi:tetratricopeptide (TPR) repeat protein